MTQVRSHENRDLPRGPYLFARDFYQHAGTGKRSSKLLVETMQVRLAFQVPGNAIHTIFSQDARPQGVVQVRDQTFLDGAVVD
jgi:hypothetical protein